MTPTPDDVRLVIAAKTTVLEERLVCFEDADLLARFADAVLNPPSDVAEAVERRGPGYLYDDPFQFASDDTLITNWFLSLITPTAKETT